ncbi:MAG: endonuclease/exonuclease/phosphatase family protein [Candidatus Accumulibacter sp.]|uniref:Endonuclease/exonuclease/phosphatase family protein n=1 Tax=Candidatus Accumulibacter affinis TaxID=2954384 RepID=A0A935T710_9PROT|nr:endonuclease/exonuclease/phosphatase family protein [Candidatus Accumulibacter affinis]MBP9804563.1 endonuclease/exonuclease/phosphatase family protein [Accumulibacter sp.]
MDKIKLLYAKNLIGRKAARQELAFFMLIEHLSFEKHVDVLWAGEDRVWHTLPAAYHSGVAAGQECWAARIAFPLAADEPLPGNVEFALRYRVSGAEYWDNRQGANHAIEADAGILVADRRPLLNVGFAGTLADGQSIVPVVVATDQARQASSVTIHWTRDNWESTQETPCRYHRKYWDSEYLSNARNPNQYGCQIWNAELQVDDAWQVHYRISCATRQRVFWDDHAGNNYTIQRRPLKVLILNLHCCQEEDQDEKLSQIARAINALEVDIVCLQEVAELWNDGHGDWQTNTAHIINERLASRYHLVTDWSHLGFDRYREGVAILSRYPIAKQHAKYVSASRDPYSIHSRKVVMAQITVPGIGLINVFSAHLSWWEDGFAQQFGNLRRWASDENGAQIAATMLCGDFNIKAGSRGYQLVVASNEYDDQYLSANSPELFQRIFEVSDHVAERALDDDHRIDYIFLGKGSRLGVTSGRVVFTDQDYGRVSDHFGYVMTFAPRGH